MYDITDEGYYVGKFCSVFNAIEQIEKTRKPFIEAFCFSSIQKHYYKSKNSTIYDEFVKSIKELYTVNLGVSREERLLRAQGAMFLLMKNNDNLKKILIDEYKANIKYLPFILKK
ncbi:hypothetical protein SDC9_176784 [bioreactor metagenome]|uniref:Uncharacterized protein n=1 Tax=bioreactor metagenome TaxID=1076179 RepID=A0A645GQZ8_9ZZZZ